MKTSKEGPLVSVIVTTYNRQELLKETIDSILNQTVRNYELIVIDNFSGYDFFSHIESFNDKRIIPFQNQNNGIIAVNRNFGIKKAKGRYIAFCDDDDYWKENKLEIQLKQFDNPVIVGVGAQVTKIGDLTFHREKRVAGDLILDFNGLLQCETAALSSLVVRNLGFLFDEDEAFKFVEDGDFQLGMALKTGKQIKILAEPLIYYRIHQLNNAKVVRSAENIFNVFEKYRHEIPEDEFRLLYSRTYFGLGIKALRVRDPNAVQYFKKARHYADRKMGFISLIVSFYARMPVYFRTKLLLGYYQLRRYLKNVGV